MIRAKLLSTRQAAEWLGVSDGLVRRLCRQGTFGTRIGERWVVTEAELGRFRPRPRGRPKGWRKKA